MKIHQIAILFFALILTSEHIFARSINGGDVVGRNIFGLATDYQGDPMLIDNRPLIYTESSFTEMVAVGKSRYLISGFSHRISGVYITKIGADLDHLVDTVPLNLAKIDGLSSVTGGVKTAWNSIIVTESSLVNAANPTSFIDSFKPYYKGKANLVNPYKYGWVSEIIVLDSKGSAKSIKNYALGRVFASQVLIMPDNKTIYMLDKLGNLFLYVTEQKESLAKGKLYAFSRQGDEIRNVLLGKSAALKVKFKLKKVKFKSIFKSAKPKSQLCKKTYKYVETVFGEECLKVNKRYKNYAAFFEPIRVLAIKEIPSLVNKNSRMEFDVGNGQLTIYQNGQGALTLAVDNDSEINSQYIIKEAL